MCSSTYICTNTCNSVTPPPLPSSKLDWGCPNGTNTPRGDNLWPWPLTSKSIVHILDSWGVCMWSFMMIGVTRHVFVKHRCPRRQQSQNMAKISKSYILTPPHPQGQVMSVKCEEPLDELTVQVWLLYLHTNFIYWTLFVCRTELRTDGQTDDPITRCPRRTFQAGGIERK